MERSRWLPVGAVLVLVAGLLMGVPAGAPAAVVAAEPEVVSFTPFRAADTRDGTGVRAGVVPARGTLEVPVAGRLGVPGDAAAVVLSVAAVTPSAGGHLTVWPCGQARPTASVLNYPAGRTVANMALARPGAGGKVCVYTHATTHLIADVAGYWPRGSAFAGLVPVRAADTRDGTGVPAGAVPARTTLEVPVAGKYAVPADAAAVAVNVAAVTPSAGGHLTVWPCGAARPTASNVNYVAGETTADAVVVKPGVGGRVCVYTHAATHLIADVAGYLAAGSAFGAMVPVRAADTRYGTGVPAGVVPARGTLTVPIAGRLGVPAGAGAVSVTVTAVTPSGGGHLTVYPCGDPRPTASNVNYVTGRTMAAAAVVRLGEGGKLCVYTHAATHLIVDVNGHYDTAAIGSGVTDIAVNGAVEVGAYGSSGHACAVVPGGYVKCWGWNGHGQLGDGTTTNRPRPTTVVGIIGAVAVDAGRTSTCALLGGGAVHCWGDGYGTRPVEVDGLAGATAISVPAGPCAIVVGQVRCWSDGGVVTKPGISGATALVTEASGKDPNSYGCVIVAGGAVQCWGGWAPDFLTGSQPPFTVAGLSGVTSLAIIEDWVCATVPGGQAQCWQLQPRTDPSPLEDSLGVEQIVLTFLNEPSGGELVSDWGLCTLRAGTVTCDGETVPLTGGTRIGHSGRTGCAIGPGGNVDCWGNNTFGELGDGTTFDVSLPVAVPGVAGALDVATRGATSCAIQSDGAVQCWGSGDPVPSTVATGATGIALGPPGYWEPPGSAWCAIVAGGAVTCSSAAMAGPGVTGVTALTVGGSIGSEGDEFYYHACAIKTDGTIVCWGNTPPYTDSAAPVTGLPAPGRAVEAVGDETCALLTDGRIYCWQDSLAAEPVPGITGAVAFDQPSRCAIVAGGEVRCWDGAGGAWTVSGISGARAIDGVSEGYNAYACVITDSGGVTCFAASGGGVESIPISGAVALSARGSASCAVVAGGSVWCWGANPYGSVGVNPWGPVTALL